jgi:hypothetical protein
MAILSTIFLPSGLTVVNAYTRISDVQYTKDELTVSVATYADQTAREAGKPTLLLQAYMLPWTATLDLAYCYTQLKLLPDFGGAVDV